MNRFVRIVLASLGLCSGCSKSPVLTPAQFTSEAVEALREHFPSAKVEVVEALELRLTGPDGHECNSFLYNAYDLYRLDPTAKAVAMDRVVTTAAEAFAVVEGVDRARIVPVVRDKSWLEETDNQLRKRGAKEFPERIYDDLDGSLIILYGEDSAKSIRYFTPKDLEVAKIERSELRTLACENLKRLLPKIERHGSGGLYMLTAGGDYEASLLLLDSIWDSGQMDVAGDIVVAIPTRDLFLVTGSEDPAGIAKVKQMVQEAYSQGPYRLTPKLFVRRDGRFVELEEGAGPRGAARK